MIRRFGIVLVSLVAVLFSGSRVAVAEGAPGVMGSAPHPSPCQIGGFSASLFSFKTLIEDDGTDKGGGWQVADAKLNFVDGRHFIPDVWSCTLTIGMPLRTAKQGKISAERAAQITANVATQASSEVMHTKEEWIPKDFCNQWRAKMKAIFRKSPYDGIGPEIKP